MKAASTDKKHSHESPSAKVQILWLSDVHLGFKQFGLSKREQDFQDAHQNVIALGLKRKVNCFLDSGDILNSNRPSPATMNYLRGINVQLEAAEVPYYLVAGNHDITQEDGVHWIDVIGGNSAKHGGIKLLDQKIVEVSGVKLYGIGHMSKEEFLALDVPKVDIISIHAPVMEFIGFTSSNMLSLDELPLDKAQFIALGDIHINDLRKYKGIPVGYTGSTSLNSFSESESKYVRIIIFEDGKWINSESVEIVGPTIRTTLKIKVEDGIQLEKWLGEIVVAYADVPKKPLIYVSYPSTLDAMAKCRALLDPNKWILRFKPYSAQATKDPKRKETQSLTPMQFMQQVMRPPADIAGVVVDLLNPTASASEILDAFVETSI